jgi:hypothetical protein
MISSKRAFWIAAATVALCCSAGDANALTYKDILGNWCSATARLEFSRDAMGVFLFASNSRSKARVTKYQFDGPIVTVYWMKDGEETSSDFGEFSADGRTMFLQPAENVPRREYRRC